MKRFAKILQSRMFITVLLMLFQVVLLFVLLGTLAVNFSVYYIITLALSGLIILDIANQNMNPSFKLPWVILVMAVPVIGAPLYILFAKSKQNRRIS